MQSTDLPIGVPAELYRLRFSRFLLGFAIAWGGVALAWALASAFRVWWVWLLAALVVGVQQNAISNLLHDAFHWRAHPSRRGNDFIARWFLSGPLLLPLGVGRASHLTHHRLLSREADPDRMYYGNRDKATRPRFVLFLISLFSGVQFLRVGVKVLFARRQAGEATWDGPEGPVSSERSPAPADVAAVLVAQAVAAAVLWRATGLWWAAAVLWWAPMVTVLVGLNSLRTFCEHVEFSLDDGERARLYTCPSYFPESWVFAPFNMNYHADHHLQVAVPYYNLPKLQQFYREHCAQMPYRQRPTYLDTLRRYWRALPLKPEAARA